MDLLSDNNVLSTWLIHYGSFTLFLLLTVGIIAFPVPEETLMVLAGILMHNGKLLVFPTIAAALAGSICGITGSYTIGRTAGYYFIHKYGRWINLTEEKLDKTHKWFERFGKWSLFIGYFIPGIRHFTGFLAGTTALDYKKFALFAYSGALIWVTTFLSIGYFFGDYWHSVYENIEFDIEKIVISSLVIISGYLIYRFKK